MKKKARSHTVSLPGPVAVTGDDPPAIAARHEERRRLWETAERTLTRVELSAMWLRYADELTHRDIAKVLGKTTVGVRVMLFRARERLLAALEPEPDSEEPGLNILEHSVTAGGAP